MACQTIISLCYSESQEQAIRYLRRAAHTVQNLFWLVSVVWVISPHSPMSCFVRSVEVMSGTLLTTSFGSISVVQHLHRLLRNAVSTLLAS